MSEALALFDFDGTLSRRDTLLPFLRALRGNSGLALALLRAGPTLARFAAGRIDNQTAKEALLGASLGGERLERLHEAGRRFADDALDALLRPAGMARFESHRAAGHRCVLVSASLDLYLEPWARRHGFDAVLCSRLAADATGRVDGRLAGRNCHGEEKVARIRAWLGDARPTEIHAYGDTRGDLPMLRLADHGHMLRGGRFEELPATDSGRDRT